ncbi:MAG TPA: dienelactone hydrolase [Gammaproteobacteria bacterium]|nr:dienelactone hydrolase [Gammaproteobacteria bacterium]
MKIQSYHADIQTATGVMRTYIHRPAVQGVYPAILFYSEIFQQTGPIERAAKLMASHGYAVLVPEVFHELNPIGTVLGYDDAGREKGNLDKHTKQITNYDSDNIALVDFLLQQTWCNHQIGAMGYCIGGHLAFRAALHPQIKAAACFYATDLHTATLPGPEQQHSMARLADIKGELLMIWGKQDNHVPKAGLQQIYHALHDSSVTFTWHEFNAEHAFMRDEGDDGRYDAQTAQLGYQLALNLFSRHLRMSHSSS